VVIDKETLRDEGVALEDPVTLKLGGVSFRAVLKLMLEPFDLTYVIENDALTITTTTEAKRRKAPKAQAAVPFRAPPPDDTGRTRVQIIRADEGQSRLTFFADSFAEATLSGTSDVLGPCRVS